MPSNIESENTNIITEKSEGVVDENLNSGGKININTAMQTELETLIGIGPSMAQKIIEYRSKNGDFKSIEDIKNVAGIGDSKFNAIKDDIEV